MIALAADENFNHDIVRGVLRRNQLIDLTSVQDAGLSGAADPEVLAWAASESRALVTHDVSTMVAHAKRRVHAGLPVAGVVVCPRFIRIARAIEDLQLVAECSAMGEWDNQILFLPL
jgi:hypothetical protein